MKKFFKFGFSFILLILITGCYHTSPEEIASIVSEEPPINNWKNVELTNVLSQEKFKISDFAGTPILLESFAVWCPTCTKQQRELKKLHEEIGTAVISISLDTDPNEDTLQVLNHAQENNFDWIYTISPASVTKALIDEFGVNVVNAPQAPIILICEDQSTRLLRRGVKSFSDLKGEIQKGC